MKRIISKIHEKFLEKYSAVSCSTSPYMSEKFNEAILFSEDIFSYCRLSWPRWPVAGHFSIL